MQEAVKTAEDVPIVGVTGRIPLVYTAVRVSNIHTGESSLTKWSVPFTLPMSYLTHLTSLKLRFSIDGFLGGDAWMRRQLDMWTSMMSYPLPSPAKRARHLTHPTHHPCTTPPLCTHLHGQSTEDQKGSSVNVSGTSEHEMSDCGVTLLEIVGQLLDEDHRIPTHTIHPLYHRPSAVPDDPSSPTQLENDSPDLIIAEAFRIFVYK